MKRRDFLIAGGLTFAAATLSPSLFASQQQPLKILALVFDDYETLDLHGPIEMLGHMQNAQIKLIGASPTVRSYQGPRVVTDYQLDDVVDCDLLLVPGGLGTRTLINDEALLTWLRRQASVSKKVFSVCTGSALLAKAGLLDGVSATTNKMAYSWVTSLSQQALWQPSARWVDDGRFLTSSGVSAGTDAALFYVRQRRGEAEARRIERLTEYQWNSDAANDPYAVEPMTP